MGREAVCLCNWAGTEAEVRVQLEGADLVVRGAARGILRRSVRVSDLTAIAACEGRLTFQAAGDKVTLHLGEPLAPRWAKAMLTPLPSLAAKLGITGATRVLALGELCCSDLEEAAAQAESVAARPIGAGLEHDFLKSRLNLIIACVHQPGELAIIAQVCGQSVPGSVPVWVIYKKGAGQPVSESEVRSTLLARGFVDTKVASVSAAYTGVRFTRRKDLR